MDRRLITTDCHIAPPFALVDELPEKYREHFARLETREDGTYLVRPSGGKRAAMRATMQKAAAAQGMGGGRRGGFGGDPGAGTKVEGDARTLARMGTGNVCPEAQPSFDPAEQLAELERDGVYGAVLIGRTTPSDDNVPAEVDAAYCQVVNDWLAETWGPYLDRVAPGIHLPYKDIDASVKELERAAGLGLRPALLPDGILGRPYHLPEWEPLWEAANALEVPLTLHVGGSRIPPESNSVQHPPPANAIVGWYLQCVDMGETLGWFTFSGIFERYPNLHVIMTEGYAAWLGFAIQFFDHHWTESRFGPLINMGGEVSLEMPPGYYLKRQAHATFMWDPIAINNREATGLDCLLWGNDYPHHEGSFPYSQQWIDKQFTGVPEDEIDQMVRGNAARIFKLEV